MPFCEPCDRFYNPNTLLADGSCPRCSTVVVEPDDEAGSVAQAGFEPDSESSVPWHFWLVLVLVGLYLGWRVIQGVWWLIDQAV
ncbi:MAG: hypothetical protein V3V01_05080 [Acidimicrobiales bacterium]